METESNEGTETSTPPFRALRSKEILYTEYETGERELYNLRQDPYELSDIARKAPKSLLRESSHRLEALSGCAGSDCARLEDEPLLGRSTTISGESHGRDKNKAKRNQKSKVKEKRQQPREKRQQRRSSGGATSRNHARATRDSGFNRRSRRPNT